MGLFTRRSTVLADRMALGRISKNGITTILKIQNEIAALETTRKTLLERIKLIAKTTDENRLKSNRLGEGTRSAVWKFELDKCNTTERLLEKSGTFFLRSLASCRTIEHDLSEKPLNMPHLYRHTGALLRNFRRVYNYALRVKEQFVRMRGQSAIGFEPNIQSYFASCDAIRIQMQKFFDDLKAGKKVFKKAA